MQPYITSINSPSWPQTITYLNKPTLPQSLDLTIYNDLQQETKNQSICTVNFTEGTGQQFTLLNDSMFGEDFKASRVAFLALQGISKCGPISSQSVADTVENVINPLTRKLDPLIQRKFAAAFKVWLSLDKDKKAPDLLLQLLLCLERTPEEEINSLAQHFATVESFCSQERKAFLETLKIIPPKYWGFILETAANSYRQGKYLDIPIAERFGLWLIGDFCKVSNEQLNDMLPHIQNLFYEEEDTHMLLSFVSNNLEKISWLEIFEGVKFLASSDEEDQNTMLHFLIRSLQPEQAKKCCSFYRTILPQDTQENASFRFSLTNTFLESYDYISELTEEQINSLAQHFAAFENHFPGHDRHYFFETLNTIPVKHWSVLLETAIKEGSPELVWDENDPEIMRDIEMLVKKQREFFL
jgi:hypothetical protein